MPNMVHGDRGTPMTNSGGNFMGQFNQPSVPTSINNVTSKSQMKPSSSTQSQHQVPTKILSKSRLQQLVKEIDPSEQLDDDVEEVLLKIADEFIEATVKAACLIAKHRKSNSIDVKDVQLYLERSWNMWVPGFGGEEMRPYKRSSMSEAHKQRMALIRKTLKKY